MTLGEAISGIRAELAEAMASAEDERLRFNVGDVEVEFLVDVRRDRHAKGGIRVWVAEVGADGGKSRGWTNRLKVTLHPVDTVTGRAPRISDHLEESPPRRGSR